MGVGFCCHWSARLGWLALGELYAQVREFGIPHEIRLESRNRGTATHVQVVRTAALCQGLWRLLLLVASVPCTR